MVLLPDVPELARYEDRYHPRIEPLVRQALEATGPDFLYLANTFHDYRGRFRWQVARRFNVWVVTHGRLVRPRLRARISALSESSEQPSINADV